MLECRYDKQGEVLQDLPSEEPVQEIGLAFDNSANLCSPEQRKSACKTQQMTVEDFCIDDGSPEVVQSKKDLERLSSRRTSLDFLSPESVCDSRNKAPKEQGGTNFMVRKAPKTPLQIKELVAQMVKPKP